MNERFFELALKAMNFQGAVDTDTELKLTNDELKKFAELIVQECIQVIKNESMDSGDEWEDGLCMAEDAIKHNFGVE